jgi:hypothetical protein
VLTHRQPTGAVRSSRPPFDAIPTRGAPAGELPSAPAWTRSTSRSPRRSGRPASSSRESRSSATSRGGATAAEASDGWSTARSRTPSDVSPATGGPRPRRPRRRDGASARPRRPLGHPRSAARRTATTFTGGSGSTSPSPAAGWAGCRPSAARSRARGRGGVPAALDEPRPAAASGDAVGLRAAGVARSRGEGPPVPPPRPPPSSSTARSSTAAGWLPGSSGRSPAPARLRSPLLSHHRSMASIQGASKGHLIDIRWSPWPVGGLGPFSVRERGQEQPRCASWLPSPRVARGAWAAPLGDGADGSSGAPASHRRVQPPVGVRGGAVCARSSPTGP